MYADLSHSSYSHPHQNTSAFYDNSNSTATFEGRAKAKGAPKRDKEVGDLPDHPHAAAGVTGEERRRGAGAGGGAPRGTG